MMPGRPKAPGLWWPSPKVKCSVGHGSAARRGSALQSPPGSRLEIEQARASSDCEVSRADRATDHGLQTTTSCRRAEARAWPTKGEAVTHNAGRFRVMMSVMRARRRTVPIGTSIHLANCRSSRLRRPGPKRPGDVGNETLTVP